VKQLYNEDVRAVAALIHERGERTVSANGSGVIPQGLKPRHPGLSMSELKPRSLKGIDETPAAKS
jgi:hypothetical protein